MCDIPDYLATCRYAAKTAGGNEVKTVVIRNKSGAAAPNSYVPAVIMISCHG